MAFSQDLFTQEEEFDISSFLLPKWNCETSKKSINTGIKFNKEDLPEYVTIGQSSIPLYEIDNVYGVNMLMNHTFNYVFRIFKERDGGWEEPLDGYYKLTNIIENLTYVEEEMEEEALMELFRALNKLLATVMELFPIEIVEDMDVSSDDSFDRDSDPRNVIRESNSQKLSRHMHIFTFKMLHSLSIKSKSAKRMSPNGFMKDISTLLIDSLIRIQKSHNSLSVCKCSLQLFQMVFTDRLDLFLDSFLASFAVLCQKKTITVTSCLRPPATDLSSRDYFVFLVKCINQLVTADIYKSDALIISNLIIRCFAMSEAMSIDDSMDVLDHLIGFLKKYEINGLDKLKKFTRSSLTTALEKLATDGCPELAAIQPEQWSTQAEQQFPTISIPLISLIRLLSLLLKTKSLLDASRYIISDFLGSQKLIGSHFSSIFLFLLAVISQNKSMEMVQEVENCFVKNIAVAGDAIKEFMFMAVEAMIKLVGDDVMMEEVLMKLFNCLPTTSRVFQMQASRLAPKYSLKRLDIRFIAKSDEKLFMNFLKSLSSSNMEMKNDIYLRAVSIISKPEGPANVAKIVLTALRQKVPDKMPCIVVALKKRFSACRPFPPSDVIYQVFNCLSSDLTPEHSNELIDWKQFLSTWMLYVTMHNDKDVKSIDITAIIWTKICNMFSLIDPNIDTSLPKDRKQTPENYVFYYFQLLQTAIPNHYKWVQNTVETWFTVAFVQQQCTLMTSGNTSVAIRSMTLLIKLIAHLGSTVKSIDMKNGTKSPFNQILTNICSAKSLLSLQPSDDTIMILLQSILKLGFDITTVPHIRSLLKIYSRRKSDLLPKMVEAIKDDKDYKEHLCQKETDPDIRKLF